MLFHIRPSPVSIVLRDVIIMICITYSCVCTVSFPPLLFSDNLDEGVYDAVYDSDETGVYEDLCALRRRPYSEKVPDVEFICFMSS